MIKPNVSKLKRKSQNTMPIAEDNLGESDVEYQSEDEKLTVPLNRKRGRPTKNGEPKAPVAKKPVVVRGRGRPRKSKGRGRPKAKTEEDENVENGDSSQGEAEDDEPPTTKSKVDVSDKKADLGKGGRGRPKKA